jgi:uncharacterized protein (TIGR02001 family)
MRKTFIAVTLATAAVVVPGLAAAQAAAPAAPASPHTFTGNVGIFSQYIFRGLTQTNAKPALQGGFDYSHASGFYIGTWGSNVSWFEETNVGTLPGTAPGPLKLSCPGVFAGQVAGSRAAGFNAQGCNSNSLEIDIYGGWKNTWGDWGLDVGLLQYWYPGKYDNLGGYFAKPNTLEAYGAVSWKWVSLKYSHALTNAFGVNDSKGSSYIDLSANIPIADSGFTLALHVGHQKFDGSSPAWDYAFGATNHGQNNGLLSYTDYKVGVTKEWVGLNWSAMYTSTNTKARASALGVNSAVWENVYGKDIGKGTFTIGVQKTF